MERSRGEQVKKGEEGAYMRTMKKEEGMTRAFAHRMYAAGVISRG